VRRPQNSRHSPARVRAANRHRQAMTLRQAGLTYQQIADELRYSDARSAERAVIAGLQTAGREIANNLLPLELDRLDAMQRAIWGDALAGDIAAIHTVLKIMERRAKYAGLDAPTRANISVDSHQQVEHTGAVLVIRSDGNGGAFTIPVDASKDDYLAAMRVARGDLAIEGSSTVKSRQPIDMAQPDDEEDG
jgi:hypothetical protein